MNRRTFLAVVGGSAFALGSGITASAGNLGRVRGGNIDAEFELVDAELAVDDPPEVTFDDGTVSVRGTVQYGSSSCGTAELAHVGYEASQSRIDVLVVAADDSGVGMACTDDLVETGYLVEVSIDDDLRRIAATEHHVFGEAYSTTHDLTDW